MGSRSPQITGRNNPQAGKCHHVGGGGGYHFTLHIHLCGWAMPLPLFVFYEPRRVSQSENRQASKRSKGTVKVNGSPAGYSTVVMEGDRIETDKHSSASLLLPGRMISLGSASSVVYHDGNVVPSAGAAKVTTASCHGSSCTTSSALLGSANASAQ